MRPLETIERHLKALRDQSFTDVLDCLGAAIKCLGYLRICPVRPIRIRFEEDVSASDFLAAAAELFDDAMKVSPFCLIEANDVFLWHRDRGFSLYDYICSIFVAFPNF